MNCQAKFRANHRVRLGVNLSQDTDVLVYGCSGGRRVWPGRTPHYVATIWRPTLQVGEECRKFSDRWLLRVAAPWIAPGMQPILLFCIVIYIPHECNRSVNRHATDGTGTTEVPALWGNMEGRIHPLYTHM